MVGMGRRCWLLGRGFVELVATCRSVVMHRGEYSCTYMQQQLHWPAGDQDVAVIATPSSSRVLGAADTAEAAESVTAAEAAAAGAST